jgi:hypothetical protein
LIAYHVMASSVLSVMVRTYSVSVMNKEAPSDMEWWLTVMYGSTQDGSLCQLRLGTWLIVDDFNMIYRAEDKNNG